MAQFEIKDMSFYYPTDKKKAALAGINLTIEQGQYVTVCGRSGSGKTTLLKHLKSVLAPHGKLTGEILFEGKLLKDVDLRTQSSKIGYVMQNPDNQIVTDKVWHELAFGLESLGVDQKTIRLRVAEMASYFGIQSWFHKNVNELSGGQKQLLNLASIMAMQPSVLILDEPTSQLDPIAASDFLNTVKKINRELRTTIIITEHRLEDIYYCSDKVVVIENGKIIAEDEPRKVGDYLQKENNEMFVAMPTPVQIYYGVQEGLKNSPEITAVTGKCPLTVREGAEWLDELFKTNVPEHTSVDKEESRIDPDNVTDAAVLVKEAWFRYEKDSPDVLKGITLQVPKNTLYAIVGGNGTGKSTTLKTISNICRPYRGKVLINGKKIDKYRSGELFNGVLAMLPQDPQSLFAKKTVREELEEMVSGKKEDHQKEIGEIADLCDITHLMKSHPYDLSGGEQQRAALAKVLLTHPKILLLDEPTKGIDSFFKLKFAEIMEQLKERGVTIIMVSHDVEFCARYADLVSMFFDGGIVTTNTPNAFFSKNSFYTTAANRMSRHVFSNAITNEDVITLCQKNL
ncbi:ABC transporter ATP-binding protein [Ruminococcus sp. 5_1_39BFAA]|uniref:ABC transporter ATP-binding protein n=1 Tax=Ruminococcus sp. 5_1_39BFAA TaxID=457412 RepID=UPI0035685022